MGIFVKLLFFSILYVYGSDDINNSDDNNVDLEIDILRPEFGVLLENIGELVSTSDMFLMHINVVLPPKLVPIPFTDFECFNNHFWPYVGEICQQFNQSTIYLQESYDTFLTEVNQQWDALERLWPTIPSDYGYHNYTTGHTREKRAIPVMALIGLASSGFSALGGYLRYRRIKSLERNLMLLRREFTLAKLHIQLLDSSMILQSQGLADLSKIVQESNKALNRLASEVRHLAIDVSRAFEQIAKLEKVAILISAFNVQMFQAMDLGIGRFRAVLHEMSLLQSATAELSRGKLPSFLVNPSELHRILENVADWLKVHNPERELAFTDINYYYTISNVIYAKYRNNLVIQVPAVLRRKGQKQMTLYRTQTVEVPVNTSHQESQPATSITNLSPYIATFDNHYVEITSESFQQCDRIGSTYICSDMLLVAHRTFPTCTSSIVFEQSYEDVVSNCRFHYIANARTSGIILSGRHSALLAYVPKPWILSCDDDPIPRQIEGHTFAVIAKQHLCNCWISAGQYFIAGSLDDCRDRAVTPNILYTVNAAALYHLTNARPILLNNISKLAQFDLNSYLPNVSIYASDDADVMQSIDEKVIYLDHLATMIKGKSTIYLNEAAKLQDMDRIHNWTKSNNSIYKILLFCFSVFGVIALVIVIIICAKYAKLNLITMGLAAALPQANAQSIHCEYDMRYTLYPVMITSTIAILVLLIRTLVKKCRFFTLPLALPGSFSCESHCDFYLELFDLTKCNLIYICTVQSPSCYIESRNERVTITIDFEHHFLYTKLLINWRSLILTLKGSRMVFSLPSFTYILFPKNFSIRKMNRNTCTARLLMSQHGFLQDLQPIKLDEINCDEIYTQTDVYQLSNFTHADTDPRRTRCCSERCPLMQKPSAPPTPSTSSMLSQDEALFVSRNLQSVTYKRPAAERSLPIQPTGIRTVPTLAPIKKVPKKKETPRSSSLPTSSTDDNTTYIYPVLPSQQFFEDGR